MFTLSLQDVNPSQYQAVTYRDNHLLIVAGPGTGKTHTLTFRIAQIAQELTLGQKVLAITFTNKAANEMRERLALRLPEARLNDCVVVGTFHSFCLRFLRDHIESTDLPREFCVATIEAMESVAGRLWPQRTASQRQEILEEISRWKGSSLENQKPTDADVFTQELRKEGLLDFDDLLCETLKLLNINDELRFNTQKIYPFVFVDEYQDINGVQHELLKVLVNGAGLDVRRFDAAASSPALAPLERSASPRVFLTAIGDPNQAIYGFRGADVRFFESFAVDFPGATIFYLQENYRSSPNLLKASGQMIAKEASFAVPSLTAKIYTEGRLMVHEAPTERAESEFVVHQIEKLIGGTSLFSHDSKRVQTDTEAEYSFGDMAVLYRLNTQTRILEEAFSRSGIPYQTAGQSFFSSPSASKVLSDIKNFAGHFPNLSMEEVLQMWKKSPHTLRWLSKDLEIKEIFERLQRLACLFKNQVEFFDQLSLQRSEDALESHVEKVSLMTLHSSKGLEFPVVFMVGCEENILPLQLPGLKTDPKEERRLFYVGMTRAKERLYFVHAQHRCVFGQMCENKVSLFLQDIEEQLKSYEQTMQQRFLKEKKSEEQWMLFSD